MMKNMVEATPEYATSKTVVWWDMDSCPVPNGYDPRRLGPRIDSELKNLGYNGPLTIIAIGNLDGTPIEFLQALSSTGIVIKHAPSVRMSIMWDFLDGGTLDHTPVTIMLISDSVLLEAVTSELSERDGYNFLLAYPPISAPEVPHPSSLVVCGEWLWDRTSLLKDSDSDEKSSRLVKGSEEFYCESCHISSPSFKGFTIHLESSDHLENIELENEDRVEMFRLTVEKEAEARKESQAKKVARKSKRQSKGKNLETEDDQMRSLPRRSMRLYKENNLETEEVVASSASTMMKKQSKAKKFKIEGEYMAPRIVLSKAKH